MTSARSDPDPVFFFPGSRSGFSPRIRIRFSLERSESDPVYPQRLDPNPVCLERLDPDPVNIRPVPKPCTSGLYAVKSKVDAVNYMHSKNAESDRLKERESRSGGYEGVWLINGR